MINLKAQIRESRKNVEGKVTINIRVSYQRKTRYIPTNFKLFPEQFNNKEGKVKAKEHPNAAYINIEIQKIILNYESKILSLPENIDIKTLLDVLISNESTDADFFTQTNLYINQLKDSGKTRTSEIYTTTLNKLEDYVKSDFLSLKTIDFKFLKSLEVYLAKKGAAVNGIAVHMRNIRSVFNRAIDNEVIGLEYYPFRRYKIKKEKTIKRSLTIEQMKAIKNTELTGKVEFARDFFMLSFYLIGMNLSDVYHLDKINNGRIVYRRAKTGRIYDVKVLPQALELIEKYKGKKKLLNYADTYANTNNFKKALDKYLKDVATKCEIDEPLTTYYARHTWATIASKIGISKDTISHALGHGNDTVTDVYIDFDLSKVDEANEKVFEVVI